MTDTSLLVQLLVNGVLLAGMYALMALGLNLIFGVIRVLNMAHGELLMLGGFGAFWAWRLLGLNPVFAFALLGPAFFVSGYLFQYFVVRRIAGGRMPIEDSSLLLTYGLSLVLVAMTRLLWTSDYRSVPFLPGSSLAGEITLSHTQMAAFGMAMGITLLLMAFLYRTRVGRAIRATAQNRDLAAACGVEAHHVHAVAFGIGAAVAGGAGMLLSMMYTVYPEMGIDYSLRAFVIVILGGLGNMRGAFLGAVVVGVTETFGAFYFGALAATIIPFLLILVILLFRPDGMVGVAQRHG